jgi:prophage DNA circulation protein
MPTLVMAYRLYADASRGDELRAENKVVHPAFSPAAGLALSA